MTKTAFIAPLRTCMIGTALAVLLTACGEDTKAPQVASTAEVPAAAPAALPASATPSAPQASAAADADEKLNGYISCYNRQDERAGRTIARYSSWVKDMSAGPTGKEMVIYGLYQLDAGEIAECKKLFTELAAQRPAMSKLDAAGIAYANALSALATSVGEAFPYYDRENYKDDKFAKGMQMHAGLVRDFKAFATASEEFSRELDVENDKRLAEQLAEVEKAEGRKLTYWRMSTMAQAKQLEAILGKDDFTIDAASKKLAEYEKVTDEAMAYGATNKAELPTAWFTIEQSAEEFRKAAKERLRRVRDKVPYNDGEKMMLQAGSAWMVEGSQGKLTKAYNSLIEASNNLH